MEEGTHRVMQTLRVRLRKDHRPRYRRLGAERLTGRAGFLLTRHGFPGLALYIDSVIGKPWRAVQAIFADRGEHGALFPAALLDAIQCRRELLEGIVHTAQLHVPE